MLMLIAPVCMLCTAMAERTYGLHCTMPQIQNLCLVRNMAHNIILMLLCVYIAHTFVTCLYALHSQHDGLHA